jgi:hypothetical protein
MKENDTRSVAPSNTKLVENGLPDAVVRRFCQVRAATEWTFFSFMLYQFLNQPRKWESRSNFIRNRRKRGA